MAREGVVPLSEMPLPTMIILFLAVFVLIGIYPALKRSAEKLRKHLDAAAQAKHPLAALIAPLQARVSASPASGPLNDYEIIVLQRIAQAGGKALTRQQVNAPLLFGKEILNRTLRSLNSRGLVDLKLSPLRTHRFTLSEAGRRYAVAQGFVIALHEARQPRL